MGVYQNGSSPKIRETFGHETTPGDFTTFVPEDPTTTTFRLRDPDGTVVEYVFGVDLELTNPSVGVYILDHGPFNLAGVWSYRAVGTGDVAITIEGELTILPSSVDTPVVSEPVNGPCQSWCDPQDIAECGIDVGSDTSILEDAAYSASEVLFQLSGRVFTGRCGPFTVRPCADSCGCWPFSLFPGLSSGAPQFPVGSWGPWGGGWGWGSNGCGCAPLSRALLPGYPVTSITEVKIDGVVLDPSEYRLDEWKWLTRLADTDGNAQFWPGCQRLDLDDSEDGTWSCSFIRGVTPPLIGKKAAAQLGAQIYAACTGGDCALPPGTVQTTRTGITTQRAPFVAWAQLNGRWATGLSLVDQFLSAYAPFGIRRRPVFTSAGGPRYAKVVGS